MNSHLQKDLFFLVGAERSGTTLLRLMLDSHPNLCFLPEHEFLVTSIQEEGTYPDVRTCLNQMSADHIFNTYNLSTDPSLDYPSLEGVVKLIDPPIV